MNLLTIKIIAAIAVLLVALAAGLIPFHKRMKSLDGFDFPRGEALASGVFLGAALLHMLFHASSEFSILGIQYPLAFLLAGISFLALLLMEHFAGEMTAHGHKNSKSIAILALVMLSIHSLFAGAALGLTQNIGPTLLILAAILAHKWAAGFSLAVQLNKSSISIRKSMIYFCLFAINTPIGILLGDFVSHLGMQHNYIEPTFLAIAAGTFLYIGTLHGLKRSVMVERCCNLKDFSFVILGFVLMALVAIWA